MLSPECLENLQFPQEKDRSKVAKPKTNLTLVAMITTRGSTKATGVTGDTTMVTMAITVTGATGVTTLGGTEMATVTTTGLVDTLAVERL